MHISHGGYLDFMIPNHWVAEENDETMSVYDPEGDGAITLSFHTQIDNKSLLAEHMSLMAVHFLETHRIKLIHSFLLDTTKVNRLVLYGSGTTPDSWVIKV